MLQFQQGMHWKEEGKVDVFSLKCPKQENPTGTTSGTLTIHLMYLNYTLDLSKGSSVSSLLSVYAIASSSWL